MRVSKSASQLTGRCGKEGDQARKKESEVSRKDRESGNASVCSGVVFWVLIFQWLLRRKKCNIRRSTSNHTLFAYCTWGGGKQKSDIQAPKSSVRHKRNLFMCGFDVSLTHFTVKCWKSRGSYGKSLGFFWLLLCKLILYNFTQYVYNSIYKQKQ